MTIQDLQLSPSSQNSQLNKHIECLQTLLDELKEKALTDDQIKLINELIEDLNAFDGNDKQTLRQLKRVRTQLLKDLTKNTKLVTKGYYRTTYLAVGMAAFGIPFGLMFSTLLGNFSFLGIGLPIGMTLGMAIGAKMDQKAKKEGRQLEVKLVM